MAACENCRLQIGDLNAHYDLDIRVSAMADLVVRAMRLPNPLPGDEVSKVFAESEHAGH